MNIKSITLTIISVAAAALAVSQPARAELNDDMSSGVGSNSRFHFAAHKWQAETMKEPTRRSGPPVNVRSGGVPRGIYGITPDFLAKAPPPTAFSTLARPVMTHEVVTPKILPQPKVQAHFQPAFGQAATPGAPIVATALPQGLNAIPHAAHPPSANKSVSAILRQHPNVSATRGVRAVMMTPQHTIPQVASYGQGIGYQPGGYTPSASSGGSSSTGSVYGRVLHRQAH